MESLFIQLSGVCIKLNFNKTQTQKKMTLIRGFVVQGRNTYFMKLKMNIINVKKKLSQAFTANLQKYFTTLLKQHNSTQI